MQVHLRDSVPTAVLVLPASGLQPAGDEDAASPGEELLADLRRPSPRYDGKPVSLRTALANTMENFGYIFRRALGGILIDHMDQNEEITARFMNEEQLREIVSRHLLSEVCEQIRGESGNRGVR